MKILWITNSPCSSGERGSSGIISGGWMSSLEKAVRHDVDLSIAFYSPGQKQEDFEYEGVHYYSISPYQSNSYILFRLKRLLMGPHSRDGRVLRRLSQIIPLVSPDLIHVHGTENCFGLIAGEDGLVPCGERRIPVAVSMQGIMGPYLEKYFSGIPAKAVRKYESLGCKLRKQGAMRGWRKIRHAAQDEKTILSRVLYVFGRTEFDREETAKVNPARRYFVVGEIMREPFFSIPARAEWTEPDPPARDYSNLNYRSGSTEYGDSALWRPIGHADLASGRGSKFVVVSTLSGGLYKGYEHLLRTADRLGRILSKENSEAICDWVVIGYTPFDEMVRLSEKYTGLKTIEHIRIWHTGKLDASLMALFLDMADVYCHVSHIENSPNSVCEAMLRALPVVAADVGGISSLVEDGVTGLLYPDSDAETCARAIADLLIDWRKGLKMGLAGREVALGRHSPDLVHGQLLSAYNDILSSAL